MLKNMKPKNMKPTIELLEQTADALTDSAFDIEMGYDRDEILDVAEFIWLKIDELKGNV